MVEVKNAATKPTLSKPTFVNTNEVEPASRVTMHLRVYSVKLIKSRLRNDGQELNRAAECIVGDQHGCVKLMAYDKQLDVVKEGAVITIRNAHAKVVKEHLRIEIDKWAKVEPSKEKITTVNLNRNLSDIEYELVSVRN